MVFVLPNFIAKKKDSNWFRKAMKFDSGLPASDVPKALFNFLLFVFAMGLFGFYVGRGIAGGTKMSKKIEKSEILYNDKIELTNGGIKKIEIIGSNSSYIFYLEKYNKSILVTPIAGIIERREDNK